MNLGDFMINANNDRCTRLTCTQCYRDDSTVTVLDDPSLLELVLAAETHVAGAHPGQEWYP